MKNTTVKRGNVAKTKIFGILFFALAALWGNTAWSASHTIKAVGVKFSPMFLYIEPGDTVNWENMTGHNVESIDSMVPDGQAKVYSELGANVTAVFDTEGTVVYKCTPHWGARMGGVIIVGKPDNINKTIDAYLDTLKVHRENLPAKGLLKKLRKDMKKKGFL